VSPLRVLLSQTLDPWFNLATEDWIFREMDPETDILYLWRNEKSIVIGRYQNPWEECNLSAMARDGVKLARRQSGGGAVYHDPGNTNFTFLTSRKNYDKNANSRIIVSALSRFGIRAEISERNDILVEGKKISGSAYKLSSDRAFHHGTLLIHAELSRIFDYLTPGKKKLIGKGTLSVKSEVTNLVEIVPGLDHFTVCNALIEAFFEAKGTSCKVEKLDHGTLRKIPCLDAYFRQLSDWDWCFGKTPDFVHRLKKQLSRGMMALHIDTKKGIIREVKIFTDTLQPELIELITSALPGVRYGARDIAAVLRGLKRGHAAAGEELEELALWIESEIMDAAPI
jgi:lipoate---protein ligase